MPPKPVEQDSTRRSGRLASSKPQSDPPGITRARSRTAQRNTPAESPQPEGPVAQDPPVGTKDKRATKRATTAQSSQATEPVAQDPPIAPTTKQPTSSRPQGSVAQDLPTGPQTRSAARQPSTTEPPLPPRAGGLAGKKASQPRSSPSSLPTPIDRSSSEPLPSNPSELTHVRSISQEVQNDLAKATASISTASARLSKDKKLDLEEVSLLFEFANSTMETVKTITDFEKRHPDWDVQAVSFSRIKAHHLKDAVGLISYEQLSPEAFTKVISTIESSAHKEIRAALSKWNNAQLEASVHILQEYTGGTTEAKSRLLVDQYLISTIMLCHPLKLFLLVFPEFTLASKSDLAEFVNREKKQARFFTGRTDYGVITLRWDAKIQGITMGAAVKQLKEMENYSNFIKTIRKHRLMGAVTFLVIETKNPSEDLERHLPQAIGEAVTVIHQVPTREDHSVAFCLTNGLEWRFCMVRREASSRSKSLPLIQDEQKPGFAAGAQLKALVLWATSQGSVIHGALKSAKTTQRAL